LGKWFIKHSSDEPDVHASIVFNLNQWQENCSLPEFEKIISATPFARSFMIEKQNFVVSFWLFSDHQAQLSF